MFVRASRLQMALAAQLDAEEELQRERSARRQLEHQVLHEAQQRAVAEGKLQALRELADQQLGAITFERARADKAEARYHELASNFTPPKPTPLVPVEQTPAEERALRQVREETIGRMADHFIQNDKMNPTQAREHAEALARQAEEMFS